MGAQVLSNAVLWIGPISFQGIINSLGVALEVDTPECTVFGDAYRKRAIGLFSAGVEMAGYWDAANDLGQFETLLAGTYPVTAAHDSAVGSVAYLMNAVDSSYQIGASVGEMFKFTAGAVSAGRAARGMLMENRTLTGTDNSTGQQLGAISATQKLYSALHVTAASVADTLNIIIQSDDNSGFTTPTTRATLAQITAVGSVMTEISGPITDTWWRYVFTIGGTGPSFTIAASMGIA